MVAATPQSTAVGSFVCVPIGFMIGTMIGVVTKQQSSGAVSEVRHSEQVSVPTEWLSGAALGAGVGLVAWIAWALASEDSFGLLAGGHSFGADRFNFFWLFVVGVLGGAMSGALLGAIGRHANNSG